MSRTVMVAFLFHVPGLKLLHAPLPAKIFWPNVGALGVTFVATIAAGIAQGWLPALITWAVGHVFWGVYLALRVSKLQRTKFEPRCIN